MFQGSDPKDDGAILTAIAGKADVICTSHARLLDAETRHDRAQHGIRDLTDLQLLKELGKV